MLKWLVSMVMVLCLCGPVSGETVTVTWEEPTVTGTWANVTGFDLRINNDRVINIPGQENREWVGDVSLLKGLNIFDMRASTDNGVSVWSYPAYYMVEKPVKPPEKIKIKKR